MNLKLVKWLVPIQLHFDGAMGSQVSVCLLLTLAVPEKELQTLQLETSVTCVSAG